MTVQPSTMTAQVLADSINKANDRLTTFAVTFARSALAELNTHRALCLAEDSVLEFDTTDDTTPALHPGEGTTLSVFAQQWRQDPDRLSTKRIRQVNEHTGEVRTSTVVNVIISGEKEVYDLVLENGRTVAGSKDHRILTRAGWKVMGALTAEDEVASLPTPQDRASKGPLHCTFSPVESVTLRGVEMTYDLEIAGEWPNFLANGVVVHNSRNSASSRAIPVRRMMAAVENDPFIPRAFSRAGKGMEGNDFITPESPEWDEVVRWWLGARDQALNMAEQGLALGLHKQDVNRLLEPFMMHTVIVSGTDWAGFFDQRTALNDQGNPLAYLPIYDAAVAMRDAMDASTPVVKDADFPDPEDAWHIPLVGLPQDEDLTLAQKRMVSVARVARASYFDTDGTRRIEDAAKTPEEDIALYERLKHPSNTSAPHMSPFEHVAMAAPGGRYGNFRGWRQERQDIEGQVRAGRLGKGTTNV